MHVNITAGNWGSLQTQWSHAKSQNHQREIVLSLQTYGLILFYLKIYNHYYILVFIFTYI